MRRINDPDIGVRWTQGNLYAQYDEIVLVLGKPNRESDGKTDAEWVIEEDGVIFRLYNYKNGRHYLGPRGLDLWEIRYWLIGGKTPEVVYAVKKLFPKHEVELVSVFRVLENRQIIEAIWRGG